MGEIEEGAMTFQAVPNGIEIVVNATQNGVPIVNVFHAKTPGSPTDADLVAAADAVGNWVTGTLLANKHPSYTLNSVVATDISVESGHQEINVYTTGNVGTAPGAAAGGQDAAVMTWKTANIGRSFRGRTYQGGITTATLADAQHISSGEVVFLTSAGLTLIDALEAVGLILSVLSRVHNKVVRGTGVLTAIVEVLVDDKLDTQRRRTAN